VTPPRGGLGGRPRGADPDTGLTVVGGEHSGEGAVRGDQLDSRPRDVRVVRGLGGTSVTTVLDDLGPDRAGHPGAQPVRSHDEPSVDLHWRAGRVLAVHTPAARPVSSRSTPAIVTPSRTSAPSAAAASTMRVSRM
jgi:hypothetical protein